MTDCRRFEDWLGSDEPAQRASARRHALECHDCRALYEAYRRLDEQIERWAGEIAPAPELEERVRLAVRRRLAAQDTGPGGARRSAAGERRRRFALAATLVMAVTLGMWAGFRPGVGPTSARDLLVADALVEARKVERRHARAIASLERVAEVRLARAGDPALPAADAARLLAYRDRLSSLESTIEEVREYLGENPAHSGARTVLLAAYRDKTEVLREVIALGEST